MASQTRVRFKKAGYKSELSTVKSIRSSVMTDEGIEKLLKQDVSRMFPPRLQEYFQRLKWIDANRNSEELRERISQRLPKETEIDDR